MGVIYSVSCKTCKVHRNLDKLKGLRNVSNRAEALAFGEYLEVKPVMFREGLLLSFMSEHIGHECVLFKEGMVCEDELDPDRSDEYREEDAKVWG